MMQFRNFQFPSVPAEIFLYAQQRVIAHFCPGKGELLENLGPHSDTIVCNGWFWSQSQEETAQQIQDFLLASKTTTPGCCFCPLARRTTLM